jgi:hypothetical protein
MCWNSYSRGVWSRGPSPEKSLATPAAAPPSRARLRNTVRTWPPSMALPRTRRKLWRRRPAHRTSVPPLTLMTGTSTQIMIDIADLVREENTDAHKVAAARLQSAQRFRPPQRDGDRVGSAERFNRREGQVAMWSSISLYGHAAEVQVSRFGIPLFTHMFLSYTPPDIV